MNTIYTQLVNWDLATILALLMFITGGIWLYDHYKLAPKRAAAVANLTENANENDHLEASRLPFIVDLSKSLFPVFVLVLILRSFLAEPFRIPSNSMMPTLLTGDFILVNKYTYGIRLPVLNVKVINIDSPKHGDVVVFRYPKNPLTPYIKRVIGLPGDHIVYHATNKMLYINGEPVIQKNVGTYQGVGSGSKMTGAEEQTEYLPGREHAILIKSGYTPMPFEYSDVTVPAGHYFVMGDNRDDSSDSRYWGFVPEENLIGKAFFIWMNGDTNLPGCAMWKPINCVSWQRLGMSIH